MVSLMKVHVHIRIQMIIQSIWRTNGCSSVSGITGNGAATGLPDSTSSSELKASCTKEKEVGIKADENACTDLCLDRGAWLGQDEGRVEQRVAEEMLDFGGADIAL